MKSTRRAFIGSASSLVVAAALPACSGGKGDGVDDTGTGALDPVPAPDRDPEPDRWVPDADEDGDAFAWGLQVGDATTSGALFSVATTELDALTLVVVAADGDGWTEVARVEGIETAALDREDHRAATAEVDGLDEDTAHCCAFFTADGGRRSPVARFRTAMGAGAWRKVSVGATSCLGGNYPWPNLTQAALAQHDVFLLLGDTVYADGARTADDYRAFWEEAFGGQGLRDLFSSTSVVATWDDHELGNNWKWDEISEEWFATALAAFREAIPQRTGPGGTGIWRALSWGAVLDLFVLDCRGERRDGLYVSVDQMSWLKAALRDSTARFKLILNTVPITDMSGIMADLYATDRWQGYPEQRDELLGFIAVEGITGVLWVSGDQHLGLICRVDPEGGVAYDQWEVLTGPSGSFINPLALLHEPDDQFVTLVSEWNYTRLDLDPNLGTCVVQFIGDDGAVLAERVLDL